MSGYTIWVIGVLFTFGLLEHEVPEDKEMSIKDAIFTVFSFVALWPIMLGFAVRNVVNGKDGAE